ncbi:MAG TPA: hypothetical protein VGL97_20475, partial [Bryobacteraceae bacterium]
TFVAVVLLLGLLNCHCGVLFGVILAGFILIKISNAGVFLSVSSLEFSHACRSPDGGSAW